MATKRTDKRNESSLEKWLKLFLERHAFTIGFWLVAIGGVLTVLLLIPFSACPGEFSREDAAWYGDLIGGVVGTLVTMGSAIVLIVTLNVQVREFKGTQRELAFERLSKIVQDYADRIGNYTSVRLRNDDERHVKTIVKLQQYFPRVYDPSILDESVFMSFNRYFQACNEKRRVFGLVRNKLKKYIKDLKFVEICMTDYPNPIDLVYLSEIVYSQVRPQAIAMPFTFALSVSQSCRSYSFSTNKPFLDFITKSGRDIEHHLKQLDEWANECDELCDTIEALEDALEALTNQRLPT